MLLATTARAVERRTFMSRCLLRSLSISVALVLALGYATGAVAETVSVLVVYHSATGNTEKMAQGVAEGVKSVAGANAV